MSTALLVRVLFWVWFAAAVAAGQLLILQRLPPAALPVLVLALAGLLLLFCFRVAPLRAWIEGIDLRTLVLLHVTRLFGAYFLVLFQRGELPYRFAVPAGIGEIAVAALALPVALAPLTGTVRWRAIGIWNVVGFVDLLLVMLAALRINLASPAQLQAFAHLPLSLLPTFFVPLLLATHVIIHSRVRRAQLAV